MSFHADRPTPPATPARLFVLWWTSLVVTTIGATLIAGRLHGICGGDWIALLPLLIVVVGWERLFAGHGVAGVRRIHRTQAALLCFSTNLAAAITFGRINVTLTISGVIAIAIIGALLGLLQGFTLRMHVRAPIVWFVTCVLASSLTPLLGSAIMDSTPRPLREMLSGLAISVGLGLIPGMVLSRQIRIPPADAIARPLR